jgi:hypothetical protein
MSEHVHPIHRPYPPNTLVGSFFLSDHKKGWQGRVIAEPQPGTYLIERYSHATGDPVDQTLISLSEILYDGWQFYDCPVEMEWAFEHRVAADWARRRDADAESDA